LPSKFFTAVLSVLCTSANKFILGPLTQEAAFEAIREPIIDENEAIDSDALQAIYKKTHGSPYFLQEWGYQAWNVAHKSPIDIGDIEQASGAALKRLDDGFFRVRLDRLTAKEKEYVRAIGSPNQLGFLQDISLVLCFRHSRQNQFYSKMRTWNHRTNLPPRIFLSMLSNVC